MYNSLITNSYFKSNFSFSQINDISFLVFLLTSLFSLLLIFIFFIILSKLYDIKVANNYFYDFKKRGQILGIALFNSVGFNTLIFSLICLFFSTLLNLFYNKDFIAFSKGTELVFNSKVFFSQFTVLFVFFIFIFFINTKFKSKLKYDFLYLLLLLLFFIFSLFLTNDLVGLFVCIEGVSFVLYTMSAIPLGNSYKFKKLARIRASIKYVMISLFSSSLLVFGFSLLYINTALVNLNNLNIFFKYFSKSEIICTYNSHYLSFILILVGIFFKLGIFPFHKWLVESYLNLENITIFLFATLTKILFLFILVNKLNFIFYFYEIKNFMVVAGVLSIFIGVAGAFINSNINGLLAYSSIANIGYIILLLSSSFSGSSVIAIIYMFYYSLSVLLFFICLFNCQISYVNNDYMVKIKDYKNIFYFSEYTFSSGLALSVFSLMGLPPFVSFFIKIYLFSYLFFFKSIFLSFLIISISVMSFYYYLNIIRNLFFYNIYNSGKKKIWINNSVLDKFLIYLILFFFTISSFLIPTVLSYIKIFY